MACNMFYMSVRAIKWSNSIRSINNIPDNVEEHRVAGLTRNTDCGEQRTTNTSSSVKAWVERESTSASMDFEITILVGAPREAASTGNVIWNENGTGSSSYQYKKFEKKFDRGDHVWRTLLLSLLTKASKPSLDMFAGKFTAGAIGLPSSSETNWTTMLGDGLAISGSGSLMPW